MFTDSNETYLNKDAIRQVFELGETAVNQTNLAIRISKNLQTRRLELPNHWPNFALTIDTGKTASSAGEYTSLYTSIEGAVKAYDQIWLELAIPPSDNSLLAQLKRPFHQLVLFYVNKLGQRQIIFNDRLLRIVSSLVSLEEEKSREIQALRAQVAHLQQQLNILEQKQA